MKKPELVAPGGSYNKALTASVNGADAVYLGVPFTSLRMRQNALNSFEKVKKTIQDLHENDTKAYLTMNIVPRNIDIKIFEQITEQISDLNADGIIFGDPGTYQIIRKYLPDIDLHLSTQTNTLNYQSVKFWYDMGVSRIVLARELHLNEIKEIKKQVPNIELEVFAHGSMCMSYSGRCLLGDYFSGRDSNKGECSHVCRFDFEVYLREKRRPNKLYQVKQNNKGSHILSSKDLCSIDHINEYIHHVDAIKIEGRSKSSFYAGATSKAYRHAIDQAYQDKDLDPNITNLLEEIPHRKYWSGFMFNDRKKDYPEKQSDIPHKLEQEGTLNTKQIKILKYSYGLDTPQLPMSQIEKKTGRNESLIIKERNKIIKKIYNSPSLKEILGIKNIDTPNQLKTTLKKGLPTSFDKAGPIITKQYHGLIVPGTIDHNNKTYCKIDTKNTIHKGDKLDYMMPSSIGKLIVKDIIDKQGHHLDKTTCNHTNRYIKTDTKIQSRTVLYK